MTASDHAPEDTLFAPPTAQWERLDPKFLTLKLIQVFIWWPITIAVAALAIWLLVSDSWAGYGILFWGVIVAGVLVLAWRAIRMPFVVRRWGYAERGEDVYVTSGLAFRSLQCVPYGRMQLVTVNAGPLARALGLATVQMVTAADNVVIPGLSHSKAKEVRDRFIDRGERLKAGI